MAKAFSPEEKEILVRVYPTGGVAAVMALLPKRSRSSIATIASDMGLKMTTEARAASRSRAAAMRPPRPYEQKKPVASIDTVPPEFKAVASVFHIGERIKK